MTSHSLHRMIPALTLSVGILSLACNGDGPDKPTVPTDLVALNGEYYKCEMGNSGTDPALELAVRDNKGGLVANQHIQLNPIEGDGELSTRSITTNASGKATFDYTFSGAMGHAVIMATALNDKDTLELFLRANTLIPGVQGQYVKLDDLYSDVLALNGPPASVDVYPNHTIIYANYEAALGVVVMLLDTAGTQQATPGMSVYGVIVNSIYDKTTANGIGVGSTVADVRAAYGVPDTVYFDSGDINISYYGQGMTCWCSNNADTTVFEIHLTWPFVDGVPARLAPYARK